MECKCCLEERPVEKCPTEQCTYDMCLECIGRYTDVLCPACRTLRFELLVSEDAVEVARSGTKRVIIFMYTLMFILVLSVCLGILFVDKSKELVAISCAMCTIIMLWAVLLFYVLMKK